MRLFSTSHITARRALADLVSEGKVYRIQVHIDIIKQDPLLEKACLKKLADEKSTGAYEQVRHLVEMGHTDICFASYSLTLNTERERHAGYIEGMMQIASGKPGCLVSSRDMKVKRESTQGRV